MIDVRVTGIENLTENLRHLSDKKLFDEVLEVTAGKTYAYAKQYAAVDTGELEASIYYNQQGNGWIVGATAVHAYFNEFGSWNIPSGQRVSKSGKVAFTPFLRPAAVKALGEAPAQFQNKLRAVWK